MNNDSPDRRSPDEDDAPSDQPVGADSSTDARGPTRQLEAALGALFQSPQGSGSPASSASEHLEKIRSRTGSTDRYQTRTRIGRGGQGAVYEVWDEDLARRAAMKVVLGKDDSGPTSNTPPADPETLSRFLEEAQVTGQLDHPGVVPVHELGLDHDGQVYFTMRLVQGDDLSRVFSKVKAEEEGWTQVRALGAVLKACEALAYAHSRKVIHRDLKPSNLMVGSFGEVYVMDWGLARVLQREDRHDLRIREEPDLESIRSIRDESAGAEPDSPLVTVDGRVLGTPCYMPPEQAEGRIEDLSPASDVYSMGAVLYQLLSSVPPFMGPGEKATAREVLARVLEGPPDPLESLAADAPPELVAICEKAMARSKRDRYPDMQALADDLRAFLENRVVRAYGGGALVELRKWIARNRGWAATGAAAIVLLLLTLGWAVIERDRANGEATRANTERGKAIENAKEAVAERERVLRLSDAKLLAVYSAEAENLWPAIPARVEALRSWIAKARDLYARLPQHEASLTLLRERALANATERGEVLTESSALSSVLENEQRRLSALKLLAEVTSGGAPPPLPQLSDEDQSLPMEDLARLTWSLVDPDRETFGDELRAGSLGDRLASLNPSTAGDWKFVSWARYATGRFDDAITAMDEAIARGSEDEARGLQGERSYLRQKLHLVRGEGAQERISTRVAECSARVDSLESQRLRPPFSNNEIDSAWHYDLLVDLWTGLRFFGGPRGTLQNVEERLEWAARVADLTQTGPEAREEWDRAITSIANPEQCPLYDGFSLTPQLGLLPLDRNPRTQLWEFWHPQTGTKPVPNPEYDPSTPGRCNRWIISHGTSMVLVLIPGGEYRVGAELPSPETGVGSPNIDPNAFEQLEAPINTVALRPYFLSKYEMTQAQWSRGSSIEPSPSTMKAGTRRMAGTHEITDTNPVENVSWPMCRRTLQNFDLTLPTEAQWEVAARGGTSTVYWTGNTVESLQGAANICDAFAKSLKPEWIASMEINDGYMLHAPVGSFRANGFGLHDVHGGVWELCRDSMQNYRAPVQGEDGLRSDRLEMGRLYRGGSFQDSAVYARCSMRGAWQEGNRNTIVGVRAARLLD